MSRNALVAATPKSPVTPVDFDGVLDDFVASVTAESNKLKASISASWHRLHAQNAAVRFSPPEMKNLEQVCSIDAFAKPIETNTPNIETKPPSSHQIDLHVGDSCDAMSAGGISEGTHAADKDDSYSLLPRTTQVSMALSMAGSDEPLDDSEHLLLRPGWIACADGVQTVISIRPTLKSAGSALKSRTTDSIGLGDSVRMGDVFMDQSCFLQKLIRHPDKRINITYSFMAAAMLLYDVFVFPLDFAFSLDFSKGCIRAMMWVTTIFWTTDIPFSFLQGYHNNGIIEMRMSKVFVHYIRTWLLFDILLVSIDWGTHIAENTSESDLSTILNLGRTFRISRFLRSIRVLRFMRLFREIQDLATRSGFKVSEYLLIMGRLFTLAVLMLLINHYISCVWIGLAVENKTDRQTWLTTMNLEREVPFFQYVSSLHWSLTQFTPATNNIVAVNGRERVFSTVVVIFGLAMFSTFVSSLTNAVLEIKRIRDSRSVEEFEVREFLQRKRVPMDICMLIWHYYKKQYRVQQRFKHECDILFFTQLPKSLSQALHINLYAPVLSHHPLFETLANVDNSAISQACDCVNERFLLRNREMFVNREIATHMIFLVSGDMVYDCQFYHRLQKVHAPTTVAEPTLWMKWIHCGNLRTTSPCEVLEVDALKFESRMVRLVATSGAVDHLRSYAVQYLQKVRRHAKVTNGILDEDNIGIESLSPVSDLMLTRPKLEAMVAKAFGIEKSEEDNARRSHASSASGVLRRLHASTSKLRRSLHISRSPTKSAESSWCTDWNDVDSVCSHGTEEGSRSPSPTRSTHTQEGRCR